ncbi:MAG: DNA repair exonuclease, partial [Candidatus Omnitrophica bacterium]|nr:DNA repair exonuclease [Candidatus Omnitrophota bacterium]
MTIKILHTADLHLGMRFASSGYTPEVQENLAEARFETLGALIKIANKQQSDLFVIAGDLFHTPRISRKDMLRTARLLKEFEGRLVLILPGNHDYIQKSNDPLWPSFNENAGENTLILGEPKPYDLRRYDLDLTVYPAPCISKQSSTNAMDWVHECCKDMETKLGIGIAHGSLEGLSPDFNEDYYPMSKKELQTAGVDLWLMGHTHIRYPDEEDGTEARIFFPSTPEPDGFDCSHPGYVWLIQLGEDKSVRYQSLRTGCYHFHTIEKELHGQGDVEALKSQIRKLSGEKCLVRLRLKGRVSSEIYDERISLDDELKESVLYLTTDMSELLREITVKDIDQEFTEGSFPHSLLTTLAKKHPNSLLL